MKILLTGGTGFVGEHLKDRLMNEGNCDIVLLQRFPSLLRESLHQYIYHDFRAELPERVLNGLMGVDAVIHLGAEVHGLRSLDDPELFVHTNTLGTFNILEAVRKIKPKKFIYVSSAEAVGNASSPQSWLEDATLNPSNPYAAAKAAGEMLTQSYARSFGVPALIVRTMNIFGEGQKTGKFIPDTIKKILAGETINLHVSSEGRSGSRQWLHVREFVNAMYFLLHNGRAGETYHVVGSEKTNEEVVDIIGLSLGIPWKQKCVVPGSSHDVRYSIKDTKLSTDAYRTDTFREDLETTTKWYKAHQEYLR